MSLKSAQLIKPKQFQILPMPSKVIERVDNIAINEQNNMVEKHGIPKIDIRSIKGVNDDDKNETNDDSDESTEQTDSDSENEETDSKNEADLDNKQETEESEENKFKFEDNTDLQDEEEAEVKAETQEQYQEMEGVPIKDHPRTRSGRATIKPERYEPSFKEKGMRQHPTSYGMRCFTAMTWQKLSVPTSNI